MFVRQSLDCLDGAIARACNKKSWLGAFLDSLEDTLTVFIFGGFIIWTLSVKKLPEWMFRGLIALWLITSVVFTSYTIKTYQGEYFEWNDVTHIIHDNTVIITLGVVAVTSAHVFPSG